MVALSKLFISFATVGALMFGGGYSMLPFLEREIVKRSGWVSKEELLDIFAIAQCTPGVIAVNTATYVGYKKRKIAGAVAATLGVITPSIIIILIIAALITNFSSVMWVQNALAGIRITACALIFSSTVKLFSACEKSTKNIIIFLLAFLAVGVIGLSPIWPILASVAIGLISKPKEKGEHHE